MITLKNLAWIQSYYLIHILRSGIPVYSSNVLYSVSLFSPVASPRAHSASLLSSETVPESVLPLSRDMVMSEEFRQLLSFVDHAHR